MNAEQRHTTRRSSDVPYCQEHSGQCANINSIQKVQEDRNREIENMWIEIGARVPWRIFLFVMGLLVATLSAIFAQNIAMQTKLAVVTSILSKGVMP